MAKLTKRERFAVIFLCGVGIVAVTVFVVFTKKSNERDYKLSRQPELLSMLGMSTTLYCKENGGVYPSDINSLAANNLLDENLLREICENCVLLVGGVKESALANNVIVAYAKPVEGAGYVSTLLHDKSVVAVPVEEFPAERADGVLYKYSSLNGSPEVQTERFTSGAD